MREQGATLSIISPLSYATRSCRTYSRRLENQFVQVLAYTHGAFVVITASTLQTNRFLRKEDACLSILLEGRNLIITSLNASSNWIDTVVIKILCIIMTSLCCPNPQLHTQCCLSLYRFIA